MRVLPVAEDLVLAREMRDAVAALPKREARVLVAHYGLNGAEPATLSEVAEKENLSRQGVGQLRAKGVERIR